MNSSRKKNKKWGHQHLLVLNITPMGGCQDAIPACTAPPICAMLQKSTGDPTFSSFFLNYRYRTIHIDMPPYKLLCYIIYILYIFCFSKYL